MKRFLGMLNNSSWLLLVVLLPITSLPLLSKLMGGTSVAPVSFIFLGILTISWLLPQIIEEKKVPNHAITILFFFLIAVISSLMAAFLPIPSFKAISHWENSLEAFITLGIGICLYLLVSLYINSTQKLKYFIKLVNYSGMAIIAYSLLQAAFWYLTGSYPSFLWRFQEFISSSQLLFRDRVTGFAFEPSWLAHQLNMLYLPVWLGMSLKRVSAHQWKLGRISIENILCVLGLVVLLLSFSRIGWLAFIAVLAFLLFRAMIRLSKILVCKIEHKKSRLLKKGEKIWITIGFWWAFILLVLGTLLGAGFILNRLDPRMAELFNLGLIAEKGILEWAGKMIFAERLVYWIAGFRVFLQYPIFGVGLGNSGYFFPETFNSFSYKLTEVTQLLIHDTFIPNAKNLWVRILSETGIVGFSIFVGWLYTHWKSARSLEFIKDNFISSFGLVGQIFLVGLLMEGFSLDTFALPYYWISMGLIAAVTRLVYGKQLPQAGK